MLAIHNYFQHLHFLVVVANAFAKLSKCQQFTTIYSPKYVLVWLQTLLQSYQNVSNSQLQIPSEFGYKCCKRFCKVIKMLAIHNTSSSLEFRYIVANAFAKLSKCQQFTTVPSKCALAIRLQTLLQSYQNVSNSQLQNVRKPAVNRCKRFCKVIKMLAIHNNNSLLCLSFSVANAFAKLSKCQQFTTIFFAFLFYITLQTLLQSYQNVSNSQHNLCLRVLQFGCKRFCKVIKMLAIHNHNFVFLFCYQLQTLLQSYQNVSNSQRYIINFVIFYCCKRFCKVIKMLAIHN